MLPASHTQLQRALSAEAKTYRRRDAIARPAAAPRAPDIDAAVDIDELAEDDGEPQDLDDDAEQVAA